MSSKHKTSVVVLILMLFSLVIFFQNCGQEEGGNLGSVAGPGAGGGGDNDDDDECTSNCDPDPDPDPDPIPEPDVPDIGFVFNPGSAGGEMLVTNAGANLIGCANGAQASQTCLSSIPTAIISGGSSCVGWHRMDCASEVAAGWRFQNAIWTRPNLNADAVNYGSFNVYFINQDNGAIRRATLTRSGSTYALSYSADCEDATDQVSCLGVTVGGASIPDISFTYSPAANLLNVSNGGSNMIACANLITGNQSCIPQIPASALSPLPSNACTSSGWTRIDCSGQQAAGWSFSNTVWQRTNWAVSNGSMNIYFINQDNGAIRRATFIVNGSAYTLSQSADCQGAADLASCLGATVGP